MITNRTKQFFKKHLTDIKIIQRTCLNFYKWTSDEEWIKNYEWWRNREKEISNEINLL